MNGENETTTAAPTTEAPAAKPAKAKPRKAAKKPAAKGKPAKAGKAAKPKAAANGQPRAGSKRAKIIELMLRKSGCTAAQCAEAVGWDSVSVPMHAKRAGIKLRQEKQKDGTVRYWGK